MCQLVASGAGQSTQLVVAEATDDTSCYQLQNVRCSKDSYIHDNGRFRIPYIEGGVKCVIELSGGLRAALDFRHRISHDVNENIGAWQSFTSQQLVISSGP